MYQSKLLLTFIISKINWIIRPVHTKCRNVNCKCFYIFLKFSNRGLFFSGASPHEIVLESADDEATVVFDNGPGMTQPELNIIAGNNNCFVQID